MDGLSAAERRRLAELERGLRADARLTALLSDRPEQPGRRRSRPPLPWILLVSWVVLGLFFGGLVTGAMAAVVVAVVVAGCAVLLALRHGYRRR